MGDINSSDCSWKKMVIAKSNNSWTTSIKADNSRDVTGNSSNFSVQEPFVKIKTEIEDEQPFEVSVEPDMMYDLAAMEDPLLMVTETQVNGGKRRATSTKDEPAEARAKRLAKMSAYAAQRLANETPEQRAARLKRMSEYAARRLATESSEQREKRLSRMSAYAARRLAQETPEQRAARLKRMSAYAAKRNALKKITAGTLKDLDISHMMPNQS